MLLIINKLQATERQPMNQGGRGFESLWARHQILMWRRVLAISEYSCGLLRVGRLAANTGPSCAQNLCLEAASWASGTLI
jgi:hypothetical protein